MEKYSLSEALGQGFKPGVPDELDEQISHAASMAGVPVDIATRLVQQESSGNPRAKSPVGAMGLTQLMPDTAKSLGVSNPYDPAENLAGGFKYLASMKKQFGSWDHALAAYNWGPGNVQSWLDSGADPNKLPAETRAYIAAIAPKQNLAQAPLRHSRLQMMGERVHGHKMTLQEAMQAGFRPDASPSPAPTQSPKPQPQGIHLAPSEAQQLAGALYQHGLGDYRGVARTLADASQSPTAILNAVLGAPQRLIAGALAADQRAGGLNKASLGDETKGALYGMFHPNDPNVEQQASQSVHLPHNTSDSIPAKIQNFATDMGFQTLTDPLTYAMGPARAAGEKVIGAARNLGTAALRSGKPLIENIAGSVIPHAAEQVAFTPKGKAAVVGIRNSEDLVAQRLAHSDAALLKKYKTELSQGKVPNEVRQRLLQEAYVYGTPAMRKQAVQFGYEPSVEEAAKSPEGVLHYTLKPEYFPHVGKYQMPPEFQEVARAYNIKPNARFEKQQTSEELPEDPLASMEYRLNSGRNIIRHRMIQKRIANETGLGLDVGNHVIQANPNKIDQHVHNLSAAQDILNNAHGASKVKGFDFLRHLSNIGRDTLIGANPLPHMKNIGFLGYLDGGLPVVGKGIYYAAKGVPKHITDWLEKYGAATHFALTTPDEFSLGARALGPIRGKNAQILDRFDTAMRAAAYEKVIKEFPKLSPYEQAEKINEAIGAYKDSPAYVEALRSFAGAQFPQWHGYIVPTAVGRAALKNPQRVESVVRAQDNTNQDFVGPKAGYGLDFGGPVNEFGTLTNSGEILSGKDPTYLTSPSILGPVLSGLAHTQSEPQSFDPPGGNLYSQILPYYSIVAPQLGINPYNSKAPANVRSLAAFFAAYPKAQESAREAMVRNFMQNGMNRFKAEQQAQRLMGRLRSYLH